MRDGASVSSADSEWKARAEALLLELAAERQRNTELSLLYDHVKREHEQVTLLHDHVKREHEQVTREYQKLQAAYRELQEQLQLLRHRIFVAKAERVDTRQLELEFKEKLAALDALSEKIEDKLEEMKAPPVDPKAPPRRPRPSGRRQLSEAALPETKIPIVDDEMEKLVQEGKAERIDVESSYRLGWQRGGHIRIRIERAVYRVLDEKGETQKLVTAPLAPETFERSLAAPSLLAHVASEKHRQGMPLYRIEKRSESDGVKVDRGSMSRWLEDAGAVVGATVVEAMHKDAFATSFCLATDATGIAVQPVRSHDGKRQACRRGHYFVQIADRDHVFFEYTPKETSAAVLEMFRGFSGFIQADAKSVYDILFRPPELSLFDDEEPDIRLEVGCWSHCRRRFWELALCKHELGREGVARIAKMFELEATWRGRKPEDIAALRNKYLRPHFDAFFEWATAEYQKVRHQRGPLRGALGYAVRQKDALCRVLDDGRLIMDNNRSERELRRIAVGRKAWLFVGSDDHAQSAGHLLSLIASCQLHQLDPEAYLRDLFRVLAHWPRDRYLELAPKYWAATRARLVSDELAREYGPLTVPPPLAPAQ